MWVVPRGCFAKGEDLLYMVYVAAHVAAHVVNGGQYMLYKTGRARSSLPPCLQVRPSIIILYEPDLAFIRQVGHHSAPGPGEPLISNKP